MKFFYNLYQLGTWVCTYADPFLVQYELPNPTDERTRMYIVFNGVDEYMRYMKKYSTCHEVFISSNGWNREDDVQGHPVFDIDAPLNSLSPGWKEKLENDITNTLCIMFPRRIPEIREAMEDRHNIVWMRSDTDKKISYHLVITGITFAQWRWSSIIMYRLLKKDNPFIDDGIASIAGSLRLVFNSKVGGNPLYFEEEHSFVDSLVLIHNVNLHTIGVMLMSGDIDRSLLDIRDIDGNKTHTEEIEDVGMDICNEAFAKLDKQFNTGLMIGTEDNGYITLPRVRPGVCPISGRVHDKVGGYLFSKNKKVFFGCYRKCCVSYNGRQYRTIDITPYRGVYKGNILDDLTKEEEDHE